MYFKPSLNNLGLAPLESRPYPKDGIAQSKENDRNVHSACRDAGDILELEISKFLKPVALAGGAPFVKEDSCLVGATVPELPS